MRVALLCDIDQTVYHVGDEAIFEATSAQLRERGLEVVPISRGEKYGPDGHPPVSAVPALTFPWPEPDRARYLGEIRAVLGGDRTALPPQDKLFGIIEALRSTDALVIGGGGSLNSRYGWLLYERLATALVMRSLGKPVLLTGQSLGPALTPADRPVLRELLDACELVGVRDADSYALARDLCPDHPALVETQDDALLLPVEWSAPESNRISVTVASDPYPLERTAYLRVLADVIEALAERTGATIELVPHMADPDVGGGDLDAHDRLAEFLNHPCTIRPLERCRDAAARTAGSAYVITTRFHGTVFGLLAGAGVLALPHDTYGFSRIEGAFATWGLEDAAVPLSALWDPATGHADPEPLSLLLDAFLTRVPAERERLAGLRQNRLAAAASWWDTVAETLTASSSRARSDSHAPAPLPAPPEASPRFPASLRARLGAYLVPSPGDIPPARTTIIMRTRDRPLLLDRAIRDVLDQTRTDWRLVVVDDAGELGVAEAVVDRHARALAGRAEVLRLAASHGMEAASNAGLAAAAGEFVAIHDDDDTWQPCFLQETIAHLDGHPDDAGVAVGTRLTYEHQDGLDFVVDGGFLWEDVPAPTLPVFMRNNRVVPIGLLYRRTAHEDVGPYAEDLPVVGDYDFLLRLLERHRVGRIDRELAQWRQRPVAAADSADANSVISQWDLHEYYDARLRERYFRQWTQANGIGLPLFINKAVVQESDRLEGVVAERTAHLEMLLAQALERLDRIERQTEVSESRKLLNAIRRRLPFGRRGH